MKPGALHRRLGAWLIDAFLIGTISLYPCYAWHPLFLAVVIFIYNTATEGSQLQATPGKRLFGLRVAAGFPGTGHVSMARAALRAGIRLLSAAALGLGYLPAFHDEHRRTWHDKLSGTWIVEDTVPAAESVSRPGWYAAPTVANGQPQIVGLSGPLAGRVCPATTSGVIIGRDPVACRMACPAGTQGVSRHHCVVTFLPQAGMFIIKDMGSSYGTCLEGRPLLERGQTAVLQPGDRFWLGSPSNLFQVRFG